MVLTSGMSVSRCLCVYDYDSTITNFHESCLISFALLMVGLCTCTCTCNQVLVFVLVLVLENFWSTCTCTCTCNLSTCTRTCTCILGTCAISGHFRELHYKFYRVLVFRYLVCLFRHFVFYFLYFNVFALTCITVYLQMIRPLKLNCIRS